MKKTKLTLSIVLILVLIGLLAFFAMRSSSHSNAVTVSSDKNPITIGAVLSLTGAAASFGEYSKNGMNLAASEINKAGGINGRSVKIIYEDDKTDSNASVSAYTKLTTIDHVNGVIGGLWDFVAQPIFPSALSNKNAFISPSNFRIAGGFEPNAQSFVMLTDFNKVIRTLTDYFKQPSVKKIAVVHFQSTFGNEIAKTIGQISREVGKGGVIDDPYASIGSNDFRTTIVTLKQQKVDTVFIDMVDVDTVTFLTQSKQLGFTPQFITYVGAYDAFTSENKYLLEGVIVLNWEGATSAFVSKYKAFYGTDPAKSADRAYDAVYVLAQAIANTDTNADVAAYIASTTFTTINGPVQFLPTHEVSTTPVEIDAYKNDVLVPYHY